MLLLLAVAPSSLSYRSVPHHRRALSSCLPPATRSGCELIVNHFIGLGTLGVVSAGLALVDAIATGGGVTQLAAGTGLVGSAWSALGRPPAAARYPHGLGYSAAAAQQFSA